MGRFGQRRHAISAKIGRERTKSWKNVAVTIDVAKFVVIAVTATYVLSKVGRERHEVLKIDISIEIGISHGMCRATGCYKVRRQFAS